MSMEDEADAIRKMFDDAKEFGDTRGYLLALERAIEFRRRVRMCLDTLMPINDYANGR